MSSGTLAAISRPVMLAAMLLAAGQPAFAAKNTTMKIVNNTSYNLVFQGVQNRQAIQIKSSPPDSVQAGQIGSFEISGGNSMNDPRLKLKYNLINTTTGQGIGSVDLGITTKGINVICFAHSSTTEVAGSTNGCKSGNTHTYTYK